MIVKVHQIGLMQHKRETDDKEGSGLMTKNRIKVGHDQNKEWDCQATLPNYYPLLSGAAVAHKVPDLG